MTPALAAEAREIAAHLRRSFPHWAPFADRLERVAVAAVKPARPRRKVSRETFKKGPVELAGKQLAEVVFKAR